MLSSIVEAFASFKEYRVGKVAKGRPRHPLLGLLMILFLSRVAGCRGWDASADWARAHFEVLRRHLPLWIRPPSADTLRPRPTTSTMSLPGSRARRCTSMASGRHRRRPGPPFHRGPVWHGRHDRD